jgi:starvation-inducible DNA-binding protein
VRTIYDVKEDKLLINSYEHSVSTLDDAAREATAHALQAALVDLIDLSLVAKQAHWNVIGPHFKVVHEHLDELVGLARRYADEVAERAATIGSPPDGRAGTVASTSVIPTGAAGWQNDRDVVASVTAAIAAVARRLREHIDVTGKTDPVTQDLMIQITAAIEQALWMWRSQLTS